MGASSCLGKEKSSTSPSKFKGCWSETVRLKTEDFFSRVNGEEKDSVETITVMKSKGSRTSIVANRSQRNDHIFV